MDKDTTGLPNIDSVDDCVFILRTNDDLSSHLIALGVDDEFVLGKNKSIEELDNWINKKQDWIFGYLSYDLKNKIEQLTTEHPNKTGVSLAQFVCPKVVFSVDVSGIRVHKSHHDFGDEFIFDWYENYIRQSAIDLDESIDLVASQNKEEYLKSVNSLKEHIHAGDIYEINYCQEFYTHQKLLSPFNTWLRLNERTMAPFSAFVQLNPITLMCGSPERFLKRTENSIISQPIKGTIKRSPDEVIDQELKKSLHESLKERTENVMIVDLVRNDLSKSALRGSVKVEKQFEPVTFKTVHHLVSTISAQVSPDVSFIDLIKNTFPMGSMTGAPKIRAMQLSDQYEKSSRGLYSGSVGYIKPNGDFDFNVVIRSLIYNSETEYISSHVGGAITALCDPEKEYEECLLKIRAVIESLGG